ncbi:hypothetical protein F5972_08115 [Microbispora cellulosiformans]|uniref:Uncharacterized protein n=1 Tax=Microbispora cellulosiformans TaxID=2614688 RepID=A0A5J5K4T7_9ACTN|nr:hypothetical protein [Microbispora cellulosiformans]KAA9379611.1 hypothetical protein F5972_08115 [Microbispora cellulosiformans]
MPENKRIRRTNARPGDGRAGQRRVRRAGTDSQRRDRRADRRPRRVVHPAAKDCHQAHDPRPQRSKRQYGRGVTYMVLAVAVVVVLVRLGATITLTIK